MAAAADTNAFSPTNRYDFIPSLRAEDIRKFFEAHLGPLPSRDQVAVRCPFHDDRSPSLSINLRDGVWKCHTGCGEGGLIDFQAKIGGADRETAREQVNQICGAHVFGGTKPEAVYHYRDAQRRPVFQKLRFRKQDGGKYFIYRRWTPAGYVQQTEGVAKPLYNLPEILIATEIFVTEGEKNADDLARALEPLQVSSDVHVAVTTSHGGAGCWSNDYNGYFLGKRVVILADNDQPGQLHAEKIAAAVHPFASGVKIVNLSGLEQKGDVSDYLADHPITDLLDEVKKTALWSPACATPAWRAALRSYEQLEQGKPEFLIDKILPHGITFFSGLSGVGKTWVALSAAKAIASGQSFLQNFRVPHPRPVLYLVPESGERAFRNRLDTMKMTYPEDLLLCRTMGSGPTLGLDSAEIVEAARALKPVIVLDTVARFNTADDENSAAKNQKLVREMFGLLSAGAKGIIAIHHSGKDAVKKGPPSLENALRGTGDFGAMADAVYDLRCSDATTLTIDIECVKARDFEPLPPFQVQGSRISASSATSRSSSRRLMKRRWPKPSAKTRRLRLSISQPQPGSRATGYRGSRSRSGGRGRGGFG